MAIAARAVGIFTLAIVSAALHGSRALSCWGKDSINTSNKAWCSERSASPNSMSMCLYQMASIVESCTTSDQCMTISAAATWPSLGGGNSSQPIIFSFAGCFKQNTTAFLCSTAQSFETDAMPTDATLTVEEATTATTRSTSSAALSSTPSTAWNSSTSPATPHVASQSPTLYPNVGSCLYSSVNFANPTCAVGAITQARLTNGTGGSVGINFTVTSCCNDSDQCNNHGSRPSFTSWCYECVASGDPSQCGRVAVCPDCWAYTTTDVNGVENTIRGCDVGKAAMNWPGLTSPAPSSCTVGYEQSVCNALGNGTVCYRCCTGFLCNDWTTVVVPGTKAPSSGQGRSAAGLLLTYVTTATLVLLFYTAGGDELCRHASVCTLLPVL